MIELSQTKPLLQETLNAYLHLSSDYEVVIQNYRPSIHSFSFLNASGISLYRVGTWILHGEGVQARRFGEGTNIAIFVIKLAKKMNARFFCDIYTESRGL